MEKGFEFLVDSREKKELTLAIVERKGIPHRVTALTAGDFALRDLNCKPVRTIVGIERKAIPDLMGSIQSQRIFEQCKRLVDLYDIPYLMISGDIGDYLRRMDKIHLKTNINVIYGTIASLSVKGGIQVMWFPDDVTLIDVAYRICEKVSEGKYDQGFRKKEKYLNFTARNILSGVPGITPSLAGDLLKTFGDLKGVANAPKDDLTKVKGVGDSMADKIITLFNTKYQ
jgi:ERCC4-type nuclease